MKLRELSLDEPSVHALIAKLDQYQIDLYGRECCHLDSIADLKAQNAYMVGADDQNTLIAMGAIKLFQDYGEIKRMYIEEAFRSLGLAKTIIEKLEEYARTHGIQRVCLETGQKQVAAMKFYRKMGYTEIERFGSYQPNTVSVFLQKNL